MPPRAKASPAKRSKSPPPAKSTPPANVEKGASKLVQRKRPPPGAKTAIDLTPAPSTEYWPLWKRPNYFSDDDTRPHCRGAWYAFVRETCLAWLVLAAYAGFALWKAYKDAKGKKWPLQACRLVHSVALALNVLLSDKLHNNDRHLGKDYVKKPDVVEREQKLHAYDWCAALSVPASYHVLLIFGIMNPKRVGTTDYALLAANLALCALMWMRIRPSRITPKRELFLSFVLTFAAQMGVLLAAFYRERPHHPLWLPLWGVYALGLVAKALEFPNNNYFGHHEVLHASCILGHALGMLVDVKTS